MKHDNRTSSVTCIRFVRDIAWVLMCMWAGMFICRMLAFAVAWWRDVPAGNDGFISGAILGAWLVWRAFKQDVPNNQAQEPRAKDP